TEKASALMQELTVKLGSLAGSTVRGMRIAQCDDFAYDDPVDGSRSEHQGIRVMFGNGARIVYRLSGTGTSGATLRVYMVHYEPDAAKHAIETQTALAGLIAAADEIAGIGRHTGRSRPSVIT